MNDIKKLKDAGLHTAERVAMTSKRKLAQVAESRRQSSKTSGPTPAMLAIDDASDVVSE